MEQDCLADRSRRAREYARRLREASAAFCRERNDSGPDELRDDGQDATSRSRVEEATIEIAYAHIKLDELDVARFAPASNVDYTLDERIGLLADRE